MHIPHQPGRDEFALWANSTALPKTRCKTFDTAAMTARFESEHLSEGAQIALAGIFFEGARRNLFADNGHGVAQAIGVRSPISSTGRPAINENRFMRLIRSASWPAFYDAMIEALLIIEKTTPRSPMSAPLDLRALYDFVRLYDQSTPEQNEFSTRPRDGFAYLAAAEFSYSQSPL
ncbi:hypothetical protein [Alcaligenes sp. SDU_A2]|uniref:hypothetical protein n=1 Tax=Alcaligenes sp. SDU_A2 TaxID=3136634 RepID=UPI00311F4203